MADAPVGPQSVKAALVHGAHVGAAAARTAGRARQIRTDLEAQLIGSTAHEAAPSKPPAIAVPGAARQNQGNLGPLPPDYAA